ncbi:MAG: hypothetical protein VX223_01665 [Myxococcota bacterium]|nr:hypothetical protein [Myxococcota bacterium]
MLLTLLASFVLVTPVTDCAKINTCDEACDRVVKLTAKRWPYKRRKTEEGKAAWEKMRDGVKRQCMADCNARGKKFIRCVARSRSIEKVSRCYQGPQKR